MLAIIKTGGKQYKVKEGDILKVEKLNPPAGGSGEARTVVFEDVLLLADDKEVKIGTPKVEGAQVKAEVVSEGKGKKIRVVKYKAKVRYHKVYGHRQPFT
ncbi:MAG: 50S ribosomal protein L21, partial [bacterium]